MTRLGRNASEVELRKVQRCCRKPMMQNRTPEASPLATLLPSPARRSRGAAGEAGAAPPRALAGRAGPGPVVVAAPAPANRLAACWRRLRRRRLRLLLRRRRRGIRRRGLAERAHAHVVRVLDAEAVLRPHPLELLVLSAVAVVDPEGPVVPKVIEAVVSVFNEEIVLMARSFERRASR